MAAATAKRGGAPTSSTTKAPENAESKPAAEGAENGANGTDENAQAEGEGVVIVKLTGGKPDPAHHNAEMDSIKAKIDGVQAKVNDVRAKLGGGNAKDSPAGQRRAALRAELDELRGRQAGSKGARGKVLDELKLLQEGTQRKIKDLQAAKAKAPYKSLADVEAQIARLEAQVESGSMKLVDEKRALAEISQLRKSRKNVESFTTAQEAIDADRAKADELRAALDDPESKATSARYDAIKAELDELNKEQEGVHASRGKLLDERTSLSKELDALYQARRDRQSAFRAENDKYYAKVNAEREKRLERQRSERKAEEDAKRIEYEQQLREEAALPAFGKEIEDCDVLINYFNGKTGAAPTAAPSASASNGSKAGLPKLELRKVKGDEAPIPEGARLAKKKGNDDQDAYFVGGGKGKGGKGKGKNKRGTPLALGEAPSDTPASPTESASAGAIHVPLGTLSALLAFSIPPPANGGDIPRVIENLKLKREYFVSNQDRVTKENVARVEKMLSKNGTQATATEGATAPSVANGETQTKADDSEKADNEEESKLAVESAETQPDGE